MFVMNKSTHNSLELYCVDSTKYEYTKTFIISFKTNNIESPVGFHPVYIKDKRIGIGIGIGIAHSQSSSSQDRTKWNELEKIRAFTSNENSFIQHARNRTNSEVLIGEIRSFLNKVTDKTYDAIIQKLLILDPKNFDKEMIQQIVKIYISKSIGDTSVTSSPD